ncbi:hypothetical protein [Acidisphaera sp. S103]|uniref:hypothetical protein n=1 Tax=Acidisphaera sp. S103 TaxID=1747223 RepID=UPI00131C57BE|nr:hypothetical protein [Acidisphaera sp. S103]
MSGERRRPLIVMAGEGPPSTPCCVGLGKGVDGRPTPAMTGLGDSANIEAFVYARSLRLAFTKIRTESQNIDPPETNLKPTVGVNHCLVHHRATS